MGELQRPSSGVSNRAVAGSPEAAGRALQLGAFSGQPARRASCTSPRLEHKDEQTREPANRRVWAVAAAAAAVAGPGPWRVRGTGVDKSRCNSLGAPGAICVPPGSHTTSCPKRRPWCLVHSTVPRRHKRATALLPGCSRRVAPTPHLWPCGPIWTPMDGKGAASVLLLHVTMHMNGQVYRVRRV